MSSGSPSSDPDIIWEGSPWVTPGLVALTAEALLLVVVLSYVELALNIPLPILGVTLLLVGSLWLVSVARLEFLARSTRYALRRSSLEVEHGIVRKKLFTISAAGFSDLELSRGLAGRILNTGDIVIETDSHRDIPLVKVRDPVRVSTMIRQMMTVPLVRVEGQAGAMPS
ncbi:MAG TPA: PH domain-containing protein [Nitrososphaerales archaeon]|nr:PH domain-containing protein [Nitrososphaerales archaeon]